MSQNHDQGEFQAINEFGDKELVLQGYPDFASFPPVGREGIIYADESIVPNTTFRWDEVLVDYVQMGGGASCPPLWKIHPTVAPNALANQIYTLPSTPLGDVTAVVNGSPLGKALYTVVGTAVTIIPALATNSEINFHYSENDPLCVAPNGEPTNIFNSDGTLTADRTVTQDGNTLTFESEIVDAFNVGGVVSVDTLNKRVGINNPAPTAAIQIDSTTGGLAPPRMTTVQRDALTPIVSELIFNITTDQFEYWTGAAWSGVAGTFNGSLVYPIETDLTLAGTVNNLVLPSGSNTVFLSNTGFTFTGIQNNNVNEQITFINQTGSNVTFQNESASSLPANRFSTTGGNFILGNGDSVTVRWSTLAQRWKYISTF